jgi:hypothetical protein
MPIPSDSGTGRCEIDVKVTVTVPACVASNDLDTEPGTGRIPVHVAVVGEVGVGVVGVVVGSSLPHAELASSAIATIGTKNRLIITGERCAR